MKNTFEKETLLLTKEHEVSQPVFNHELIPSVVLKIASFPITALRLFFKGIGLLFLLAINCVIPWFLISLAVVFFFRDINIEVLFYVSTGATLFLVIGTYFNFHNTILAPFLDTILAPFLVAIFKPVFSLIGTIWNASIMPVFILFMISLGILVLCVWVKFITVAPLQAIAVLLVFILFNILRTGKEE